MRGKPEEYDGASSIDIGRKSTPGRRNKRCKGPKSGACLLYLKKGGQDFWRQMTDGGIVRDKVRKVMGSGLKVRDNHIRWGHIRTTARTLGSILSDRGSH